MASLIFSRGFLTTFEQQVYFGYERIEAIEIYSGTFSDPPNSQNLLWRVVKSNLYAAVTASLASEYGISASSNTTNNTISIYSIPKEVLTTGTASWFKIKPSTFAPSTSPSQTSHFWYGTVGTGEDSDLKLPSVNFVAGTIFRASPITLKSITGIL